MSDELDINSIERFTKQSKRLILEELSNCEVPAGCGGVVLRWLSNEQGLAVGVRIISYSDKTEAFCNGKLMPSGCANVPFGEGILALRISKRESDFDWLAVVVRHTSRSRRDQNGDEIPEMSASHDGTWKFTTDKPSDDWISQEYDDSDWQTMSQSEMTLDELEERQQWRFRRFVENETPIFSIPDSEIWIRKRFDVSGYAIETEGP